MRFLYIESDAEAYRTLRSILDRAPLGVSLAWVWSAHEALDSCRSHVYDAIVVAARVDGVEATTIVSELRAYDSTTPILMLVEPADGFVAARGLRAGADNFITKPLVAAEDLVDAALAARRHRDALLPSAASANGRLHQVLFDESPLPKWLIDRASRRFLAVNKAATSLYGYSAEEFSRMTLDDLHESGDLGEFRQRFDTLQGRRANAGVAPHVTKSGRRIQVEVTRQQLEIDGLDASLAVVIDKTEQLQAEALLQQREEQLRQAQKMEAVAQLAGGIAHDFNNILTAIRGFTDIIRLELARTHPLQQELNEVMLAAGRAAELTRQLLAFSRNQPLIPAVLDVSDVLKDMEPMIGRVAGEHIRVELKTSNDLANIVADRAQLERAVVNLVANARDAMPDGGAIEISVSSVVSDAAFARAHAESTAERYVRLDVADTGRGMTEAVRRRLFEPFFTTKPIGQGTGLGMSTVYGIVKQSGGFLDVDTAPGRGTRVSIYLPFSTEAPIDETPDVEAPMEGPRAATILLVEDAAPVRRVVRRGLEAAGYVVIEASDGLEAVDMARAPDFHADAIVSDLVMPRLNGSKMALSLRELGVEAPVLFTSGYASDAILEHLREVPDAEILEKPFTTAALTNRVRSMIEGVRP